jgi:Flp pilus assembly protein protease CpaA
VLTATLGVGLLIAIPATALLTHNLDGLLRASAAAAVTVAVTLGVKAARPAMIGWGDVKLLPSLTAALAWVGVSTLAQGLVLWIVLLLATTAVWRVARFDVSDTVPYGPALVLGTLGALLVVT